MSRFLVMVTDRPVAYDEDLAYILPVNRDVALCIRKMLDVAGGISTMLPMNDIAFRDMLGGWSGIDLDDAKPYARSVVREIWNDGFSVINNPPNVIPETIDDPVIRVFPEEQVVRFECVFDDSRYHVDIDANELERVFGQETEAVAKPLRPADLLAKQET